MVRYMGFWLFLTILVSGNMLLKAYKWRILNQKNTINDSKLIALEREIAQLKEKIEPLEMAVFTNDFDLTQKFKHLEQERRT